MVSFNGRPALTLGIEKQEYILHFNTLKNVLLYKKDIWSLKALYLVGKIDFDAKIVYS